jgi:hypothetical protein
MIPRSGTHHPRVFIPQIRRLPSMKVLAVSFQPSAITSPTHPKKMT